MDCPDRLTCSMYADNALDHNASERLQRHLRQCLRCATLVGSFRADGAVIGAALRNTQTVDSTPRLNARPNLSTLMEWVGWLALGGWMANISWSVVSGFQLPDWVIWFTPELGSILTGAAAILLWTVDDGLQMLEAVLRVAVLGALVVSAAWGVLATLRRNSGTAASLCLIAVACGAAAPSTFALDVRSSEDGRIYIPQDETIDDTLLVYADEVEMAGTVTGDLLIFADNVTVTGTIGGLMIVAADDLNIEATVNGSILAAASHVNFHGAIITGNAVSLAGRVTLDQTSRIAGNALGVARKVTIDGAIGRSLYGFANTVEINGTVVGDLRGAAETFQINPGAQVGSIRVRAPSQDSLTVADSASVGGDIVVTERPKEPSDYVTSRFYVRQILGLLAAFLTGLVLFTLFPGLTEVRLASGWDALRSGAIGCVAAVAMPIAALIAIITIVGIPLGLAAMASWGLALYLASIVTAMVVGTALIETDRNRPAIPLLAGLAVYVVLTNVPFVGGPVQVVAIVVGLGLIVQWLRGHWLSEPE